MYPSGVQSYFNVWQNKASLWFFVSEIASYLASRLDFGMLIRIYPHCRLRLKVSP